MLLNLHKRSWIDSMKLGEFREQCSNNQRTVEKMLTLAKAYHKAREL